MHSMDSDVAGLKPVKNVRVENIQLELEGHTSYRDAVPSIMDQIGFA